MTILFKRFSKAQNKRKRQKEPTDKGEKCMIPEKGPMESNNISSGSSIDGDRL
jgi:hypothetical protein